MMETTTKKLLISTHCGIFFFTFIPSSVLPFKRQLKEQQQQKKDLRFVDE
jgi:amino acid permease